MKTLLVLKRLNRGRSGTAFIVVMMLTGILMIAGVSLTYLTSNAGFASRKINAGARALAVAEAGIAAMLSRLETNYVYWSNERTLTENFEEGYYTVKTHRPLASSYLLVTSTGIVQGEKRTTVVELPMVFRFDGCILAGGDITLKNPAEVHGDIHANGSIYGSPAGTVQGDISTCGTSAITPSGIDPQTGMPYGLTEDAPPVSMADAVSAYTNPIPMLPLSGWLNLATNGGIYYSNSVELGGVDLRPSNGVVYVNGDATINNQSSLVGTLVASGSIHINNRFDQTAFAPGWPCFIAGIDIREDNRNTYQGVLFAGNNYVSLNNRTTIGQIIAMNSVTIENRGVVYMPTNNLAVPQEVRIGGWLQ